MQCQYSMINLRIEPGEFMSFLESLRLGQTTTLNLIAGYTGLSDGEIRLGRRSIGNTPAHKRNTWSRSSSTTPCFRT